MKRAIIRVGLSVIAVAWCELSICDGAKSANVAPILGTLNGPDYLVSIDRNTGEGTRIGHLGIGFHEAMTALEYDAPHRVLYAADAPAFVPGGGTLYTVNPTTGAATPVGSPGGLEFNPKGLASDPINDILYGAGFDITTFARNNLYQVDRGAGTSTLLGAVSGISFGIQGLSFDAATQTLYALDEMLPSGARVVKIDPATLVATPVSGDINPRRTGWNGLTFDPVTDSLFVTDDREMYRVDPVTGAVSSVGMTLAPVQEVYGALTVLVPEPGSGVLAAFLLTSAVFGRLCRRS